MRQFPSLLTERKKEKEWAEDGFLLWLVLTPVMPCSGYPQLLGSHGAVPLSASLSLVFYLHAHKHLVESGSPGWEWGSGGA